MLNGEEDNID